MKQFTPNALKAIRKAASYSGEAKNLAEKLLKSTSSKTSMLALENENILDLARTIASKYRFEIPSDSEDKDKLINALLKLLLRISQDQESIAIAVFDDSSFSAEEDSDNYSNSEELENDAELAEVKEKFKSLLNSRSFSDIMFIYAQKEQWLAIPVAHRGLLAQMLIDMSNLNNEEIYPSFWQDFFE
jgi:hypothetical protein